MAGTVRHVLFLFLVALLIALLLNPLVRGLGRAKIPRGPAVGLVYLAFAAVVALAILALATVVVQQTRSAAHRVDNYFTVESGHPKRTGAEQDLAKFQRFLERDPAVGYSFSLGDILRSVNMVFHELEPKWGVIPNTAFPTRSVSAGRSPAAPTPATAASGFEIAFRNDPCVLDGRFANNGWLQELPKPITKLAWDNAVIVSAATAARIKAAASPVFTGGEHG